MERINSKEASEHIEFTGLVEVPDALIHKTAAYSLVIGETAADFIRRSIDEEYRSVIYDQGVRSVDNASYLGIKYEVDESADLRKVSVRLGDSLVGLASLALLTNSRMNAVLSQALEQRCSRVEPELPQHLEAKEYENAYLKEMDESLIRSFVNADKTDTDTDT